MTEEPFTIFKIETNDKEDFNIYFNAMKMYTAIHDAKQFIRSKIKYSDLPDETEKMLEEIRSLLHIAAFDD